MGSKKKGLPLKVAESSSPVEEVPTRNIDPKIRLHLFVVAGGHCEFNGCNDFLMEHHLTLTLGNFAQAAHIVAFKRLGPRGNEPDRPQNINDISNLMLLCPKCHKLIDDYPQEYSPSTLEKMKRDHEERIKLVTSNGPEMRTSLLIFKAPIGGDHIDIPDDHIRKALLPRYPASLPGTVIDLSSLSGSAEKSFLQVGQDQIQRKLQILFQNDGEAQRVSHLSVFAIGPIAMLIALGSQLTNKIPMEFFQRHRNMEDWTWKTAGRPAQYKVICRKQGKPNSPVALLVSLSGQIDLSTIPDEFSKNGSIYEILLTSQSPSPTFLQQRSDLEAFRIIYQEALGTILKDQGAIEKVSLFPAVPAPVAVLCGRERLPKVHPALDVYDFDKTASGFNFQLEVL